MYIELRDKKKDLALKKYLKEFIQYYEKVSKWMHLKVPKYCNILIKLNAHQKINLVLFYLVLLIHHLIYRLSLLKKH